MQIPMCHLALYKFLMIYRYNFFHFFKIDKYFREIINKEGCRVVARKMTERDAPGVTQDIWQNIRKHLGGRKSRKNKSRSKRTHKRKTINKKKHHKKSKRNHH